MTKDQNKGVSGCPNDRGEPDTEGRVLRHGGTLMPFIILFFVGLALYLGVDGLTWQRPFVYGVTACFLFLGIWGLIVMARNSYGDYPSIFTLTMIYQKGLLDFIYVCLFLVSLSAVYPTVSASLERNYVASWWYPAARALLDFAYTATLVPDVVLWSLLCGCSGAISFVNLMLWLGRHGGVLDIEADPVPLRSVVRSVRQRFRKGSN